MAIFVKKFSGCYFWREDFASKAGFAVEAVKSVWNLPRGEKNKKILKNDCPPLEIFSERDILSLNVAEMAELVDALGSGPSPS